MNPPSKNPGYAPVILLRDGNADFGLNFGCWDKRAKIPIRVSFRVECYKIPKDCTLVNHRNDINMFKTQVEPRRQLVSA